MDYTNLSFTKHVGDGSTTQFSISTAGRNIAYIDTSNIYVYVDGEAVSYTIQIDTPHMVRLDTAPKAGAEILIRRQMPMQEPYADFKRGNNFGHRQVNNSFLQQLYLTQEIIDGFKPKGFYYKQDLNIGNHKLYNVLDGEDELDAVNMRQYNELDVRLSAVEGLTGSIDKVVRYVPWTYIATGGETKLNPPYGFNSVATVAINGVDQTPDRAWEYNYQTDQDTIFLAEPLEEGDEVCVRIGGGVDFLADYIKTPDAYGRMCYEATAGKSSVDNMVDGTPFVTHVGKTCTTGATVWLRVGQSVPSSLNDFVPINDLWVEDFGAGKGADDRPILQSIIDHIEASGVRTTVRSRSGKNYLIKSTQTIPNSGNKVGLIIRNVNLVHLKLGWSQITDQVDSDKEALLALAPSGASADYAFGQFDGVWLEGNKDHRPRNVLKADYGKSLAYSRFDNMRLRYSEHDTWRMDGFVISCNFVRCSYSKTGTGFHGANGTGAANTGYNLKSCTVDYAKIYGFRLSGSNGHTYCHLDNCYADFIGLDDNKVAHDDELGRAAGFRLENVRVVNLTACGTEYCLQALSTLNARAVTIDGIYHIGSGHSDGSTVVPWRWKIEGYTERMTISGVQFRTAKSKSQEIVEVVPVNKWNENSICVMDGSLKREYFYINGEGVDTSSNMPLISTPEDHYVGNVRKGAGDALVTGSKLQGAFSKEWFNQSFYSAENTWTEHTSSTGKVFELLELTDPKADGYVGFKVEVSVGRSYGAIPYAMASYVGGAGRGSGTADISQLKAQNDSTKISQPTIAWNGFKLELSVPDAYAVVFIKITAAGRRSGGVQTFEWRSL